MPDTIVSGSLAGHHRPRSPRRVDAEREANVFLRLRAGVPISEIARVDGCSARTVRRIVAKTLARRERDATGDYAQLQIARLNDLMMFATEKMGPREPRAIEVMLKVMQAQDRYHGFGRPGGPPPAIPAGGATPARRSPRLAIAAPQRALPPPADCEEKIDADVTPKTILTTVGANPIAWTKTDP